MSQEPSPDKRHADAPTAIYVWLVPSEEVLEQPGSWRIRKWDTAPFAEANFTLSHVAPIHPLVEAVRWILQDAAYKAPEQIGVVAERWIDRLRDAMTQEGKPVSVPSTTPRINHMTQLVRQAIFHVLDDRAWDFENDEHRVDFADAVATWIPMERT